MVSRSYRTTAAQNKTLYVYGPTAISMEAALATYASTLRPGVKRIRLPVRLMSLAGRITRDAKLQDTAQIMAYYEQFREDGDPAEANTLLGAPTMTLQQWCQVQSVRQASVITA